MTMTPIAPCPHAHVLTLPVRLRPGAAVLCRPGNELQVGISDDSSVIVVLPKDIAAWDITALLRNLDGIRPVNVVMKKLPALRKQQQSVIEVLAHLAAEQLLQLPQSLVDQDELVHPVTFRSTPVSAGTMHSARNVWVIGSGAIYRSMKSPLASRGCQVTSVKDLPLSVSAIDFFSELARQSIHPPMVILSDYIVHDPLVTRALSELGIPHICIYNRDNRTIIGPTVIPSLTACTRCLDLYRTDQDPAWPQLAAQLLFRTTDAPAVSVQAAISVVLNEIDALRKGTPLLTTDATFEVSVPEGIYRRRNWDRHVRCFCHNGALSTRHQVF